jgi:hypothetical protein
MNDLIDITQPHLENIAEHRFNKKRRPPTDMKAVEDIVQYAMFEYYTRLSADNPEMNKTELLKNVAGKFNKQLYKIESLYKRFNWATRAKKLLFEQGPSSIPKEYTDTMDEMLANTSLIAKLGTKLIAEYLVHAKHTLLTPKDVFKLGMLVVECTRTASECTGGGKNNQLQGQMVKLVINE